MTQTGTLAGTMYYMAPEQAEGLEVTPAADIYAFGVIWFELLTTKKPGVGTLKIQKHRPDCPSAWEEIIAQCLESEPEDRPGLNSIKQALEAEVFEAAADRAATDRAATDRAAADFAAGVKAAADEFADDENTRVEKETPKPESKSVPELKREVVSDPASGGMFGNVFGNIFYEILGTGKKIDVEASRKRAAARVHLPSVLEPHRAGRIRIIVIIGFFCCWPGSLLGWVMGARDLKEMDSGRMDPSGRELTDKWRKISKIMCYVYGGILILSILAGLFF